MSAARKCCGTCRFFHKAPSNVRGECRRYPPTQFVTPSQISTYENDGKREIYADFISLTPSVTVNEWCGEWQATPKRTQRKERGT